MRDWARTMEWLNMVWGGRAVWRNSWLSRQFRPPRSGG